MPERQIRVLPGLPLLLVLLLLACPLPALSSERPVVGLALSGGGAKGMAHVGVLRVLEEMRVPVDVIAGTSAGAAVAALYASGMPVDEIEQRFIEMDWVSSFRDDPGRSYKPVRRKSMDWRYPVTPGLGVSADGIELGGGLVSGQNLGFILNELTRDAALIEDFDDLPIPFRAVATDLETGEEIVIGKGSLAEAIRASMSIPGVYAPVSKDGRLLIDGGVANNLPVSVVRNMGADIVIAVDITDPLMDKDELQQALSVMGQLTTLLTRRNTETQLAMLTDRDIILRPDLGELGSADFYQAPMLFELGATETRNQAVRLRRLAVDEMEWGHWQANRTLPGAERRKVSRIKISGDSELSPEFLRSRIRQPVGEPLDADTLEEDLKRIYGLGYYESASYSLRRDGDAALLDIHVRQKSWGPNYLAFGLAYEDNFDSDTRFNVASALRMTELNNLGAEWTTGLQLGTHPWIRSQWFQPVSYGFDRFVVAGVEYREESFSAFDDNGERIAEVDVSYRQADLAVGFDMGVNNEVRLGYRRGYARIDQALGASLIDRDAIERGGMNLELVHDSLDSPFLPRNGHFAGLRLEAERPELGADRKYDRVTTLLIGTGQWQRTGVVGLLYASSVTRGDAGIENSRQLGGFRQLSAYSTGEVAGNDALLASVMGIQEFGSPYVPWFVGAGFETGNAWDSIGDARWNDLLRSWSLFAGVDTFLGPVQLAAAYNNEDDWGAYLNIGFSFTRLFN